MKQHRYIQFLCVVALMALVPQLVTSQPETTTAATATATVTDHVTSTDSTQAPTLEAFARRLRARVAVQESALVADPYAMVVSNSSSGVDWSHLNRTTIQYVDPDLFLNITQDHLHSIPAAAWSGVLPAQVGSLIYSRACEGITPMQMQEIPPTSFMFDGPCVGEIRRDSWAAVSASQLSHLTLGAGHFLSDDAAKGLKADAFGGVTDEMVSQFNKWFCEELSAAQIHAMQDETFQGWTEECTQAIPAESWEGMTQGQFGNFSLDGLTGFGPNIANVPAPYFSSVSNYSVSVIPCRSLNLTAHQVHYIPPDSMYQYRCLDWARTDIFSELSAAQMANLYPDEFNIMTADQMEASNPEAWAGVDASQMWHLRSQCRVFNSSIGLELFKHIPPEALEGVQWECAKELGTAVAAYLVESAPADALQHLNPRSLPSLSSEFFERLGDSVARLTVDQLSYLREDVVATISVSMWLDIWAHHTPKSVAEALSYEQLQHVAVEELLKAVISAKPDLAKPVIDTPYCVEDVQCWREFNVFKVFLWKFNQAFLPTSVHAVRAIDVRGMRPQWIPSLTTDEIARMDFAHGKWSPECVAAMSAKQVNAISGDDEIDLPFAFAPDVIPELDATTFARIAAGSSFTDHTGFDCDRLKLVTYDELKDVSGDNVDDTYKYCNLDKPTPPSPGPAPGPAPSPSPSGSIPKYHGPGASLSPMGIVGITIACIGAVGLAAFFFITNHRFKSRHRRTEDGQYASLP
eukprot:GFYU01010700.1.p1 GENE.GFYU01010700.1~~GFYU01010700.1.p1  ORF type:complete len:747 (+),score=109.57 GFYU01010700.1:190-2430(+)